MILTRPKDPSRHDLSARPSVEPEALPTKRNTLKKRQGNQKRKDGGE